LATDALLSTENYKETQLLLTCRATAGAALRACDLERL